MNTVVNTSKLFLLPASDALVLAVCVCLCVVCVSVCLSHASIVSKQLNVGSRKQRHVIAPWLFSDAKSVDDPHFSLKFALKVTHTLSNTTISTNIRS